MFAIATGLMNSAHHSETQDRAYDVTASRWRASASMAIPQNLKMGERINFHMLRAEKRDDLQEERVVPQPTDGLGDNSVHEEQALKDAHRMDDNRQLSQQADEFNDIFEVVNDTCAVQMRNSCAQCLRVGPDRRKHYISAQWPDPRPAASHLLRVSNIYFERLQNKAYVHNQEEISNFSRTFKITNHMWQPRMSPQFVANSPWNRCGAKEAASRTALIVDEDFHPNNFYHYVVDAVFSTFITLGHIAKASKCAPKEINVYSLKLAKKTIRNFELLWQAVFGEKPQSLSAAHGCFSQAYFGRVQNEMWMPCTNKEWWFNSPLSTWWTAFSHNLRHGLQASHPRSENDSGKILLIYHPRMPDWLWTIDWEVNLKSRERRVVSVNFESLTLADQVKVVLGSRGIISHAGASFVHQIYMEPRSVVLQVYYEHHKDAGSGRGTPGCEACHCIPRTCHDMLALHLGHSVLTWKWCGWCPFTSHDASNRFAFLISNHERAGQRKVVWGCHMLSPLSPNASFMKCDVETVVPWVAKREDYKPRSCGSVGFVGAPLLSNTSEVGFACELQSHDPSFACPSLLDRTKVWKPDKIVLRNVTDLIFRMPGHQPEFCNLFGDRAAKLNEMPEWMSMAPGEWITKKLKSA